MPPEFPSAGDSQSLPRRRRAQAALGALGVSAAAMTVLHLLQDLDPWHQPVSFYVHGPHGWLLSLSLGMFGGAALLVASAISRCESHSAVRPWLTGCGVGLLITATIPSDTAFPWEIAPTVGGLIHAAAAMLAPPLLLVPMFRLLVGEKHARTRHRLTVFLLLLYLLGLVGSAWSLGWGWLRGRPPPLIGLAERVLAVSAFWWLWKVAVTYAGGLRELGPPRGPRVAAPDKA